MKQTGTVWGICMSSQCLKTCISYQHYHFRTIWKVPKSEAHGSFLGNWCFGPHKIGSSTDPRDNTHRCFIQEDFILYSDEES